MWKDVIWTKKQQCYFFFGLQQMNQTTGVKINLNF